MGKIYSINCIQLVLRDAFFSGGKLNFVLLELCPSRGLLTDLLSWRWPVSSLLLTHVSSHSAWTITSPPGMVSLWGCPDCRPSYTCGPASSDLSFFGDFLIIGKRCISTTLLSRGLHVSKPEQMKF